MRTRSAQGLPKVCTRSAHKNKFFFLKIELFSVCVQDGAWMRWANCIVAVATEDGNTANMCVFVL